MLQERVLTDGPDAPELGPGRERLRVGRQEGGGGTVAVAHHAGVADQDAAPQLGLEAVRRDDRRGIAGRVGAALQTQPAVAVAPGDVAGRVPALLVAAVANEDLPV